MNKNLFLSQEDRHSEESPLIYKWAKPVTALKAKRDADGFIAPWAMFRPLGDKGLFSAMLGENAVRRAADLRLNRDLLLKEIRIKNWQVSRISTGSKAKTRRPCLYCERNKHNCLVVRHKNPTQPCDWVGYMLSLFDFHVFKTDKVSFSDAKATKHFLFRD